MISDLMAVEQEYRGGLGYALKVLQAAVTLEAGFEEMRWTVDPLRASNARLNFERLGAYANEYIEDLYGDDFAAGLYGGMPSDRLIVTWPLTSERVRNRLLSGYQPLATDALASLPDYNNHAPARARLAIPSDIDTLLASDRANALSWRYRVRTALEDAFTNGYAITGFAGHRETAVGYLQLERGAIPR
jgi:predicted GNAT superfamily acetyltransferase